MHLINIIYPKFQMKCLYFFSEELNVNGDIRDFLEKYFKFLNKYEKQYA